MYAVEAMHKVEPDFPQYSREFPNQFVREESSMDCWMNKCLVCKDGSLFNAKYGNSFVGDKQCSWYTWDTDKEKRC